MKTVAVNGQDLCITKGIVRTISPFEEWLDTIEDTETCIRVCKEQKIPADILRFSQNLPNVIPRYRYYSEPLGLAVIPISTYDNWFRNQIHRNVRNKIRKSEKLGVRTVVHAFDRRLLEGLVQIFNETRLRRGKPNLYYGKTLEEVEKEWAPDLDRSCFIVALFEGEIIGFVKLVFSGFAGRTSGTVAKIAHRDKAPMNALIAAAVNICAERKVPYMIYGKYTYGKKGEDSLTDFKRSNGFERIEVPEYYIPLSFRGWIGLKLGLHHEPSSLFPQWVLRFLLTIRSRYYEKRFLLL